jgi:hypothetical protein
MLWFEVSLVLRQYGDELVTLLGDLVSSAFSFTVRQISIIEKIIDVELHSRARSQTNPVLDLLNSGAESVGTPVFLHGSEDMEFGVPRYGTHESPSLVR